MTRNEDNTAQKRWKEQVREVSRQDTDLLKELVRMALQQGLETEMEEALETGNWERTASRMVQRLDQELEKFARQALEEDYPYLILDARYEKVREQGTVRSQAVLVAIGVNWEARRDLAAWLAKWGSRYPKLCLWVEENIEETLSFYRLPRQHHKHLKSTNLGERLMEEIKRRTLVVRIFPNEASCPRLVRALATEIHEDWIEGTRYLDMEPLREQKKEALRRLGEAA